MASFNVGRGRGRFFANHGVEMHQVQIGKPPIKTFIKPDPITGCYKLHVKSIPKNMDRDALFNLFRMVGEPVDVYLPSVAPHVQFKWAFVEFQTYKEANRAINELNGNILASSIEIDFAREKINPDNFIDSDENCLRWVTNNTLDEIQSSPRQIESKMLTRTIVIKNEEMFKRGFDMDVYSHIMEPATQESILDIEESLLLRVVDVYKKSTDGVGKCQRCDAQCALKCSGCDVYYCSEDCQHKDWSVHSNQCKFQPEGSGSNTDLRASGHDNRLNGFKPSDSTNDNRFNRRSNFNDDGNRLESGGFGSGRSNFNDSDSNRREQCFEGNRRQRFDDNRRKDGERNFDGDRANRFQNKNLGFNRQNDSGGSKNMFEERKSRMNANRSNNDRASNFNQSSDFNKKPESTEDEEWGTEKVKEETKSNQQGPLDNKPHTNGTEQKQIIIEEKKPTGTPVSSETPAASVQSISSAATIKLIPGQSVEVEIAVVESPGEFSVILVENRHLQQNIVFTMNSVSAYNPFTPAVLNAVCAVSYEDIWCRAQVTCMEPLTVHYIDFGNSEEVTSDKLFSIPDSVAKQPPLAIKVKLADKTPDEYLNQAAETLLTIIPVKEMNNKWVVKVAGVTYPEPSHQAPKETPAGEPTAPVVSTPTEKVSPLATSTPQPVVAPTSQYPLFLPADKFTPLLITVTEGENPGTYYVGPLTIMETLTDICLYLQSDPKCKEGFSNPQVGSVAVAEYETALYRVKVVSLSPFHVYYMDFGNTEQVTPESLKECPGTHKEMQPLVQKIKIAPGTNEKYFNLAAESTISIKPVSVLNDGTVVVQVEGETYSETSQSEPERQPVQVSEPTTPVVLKASKVNEETPPDMPKPKSIVESPKPQYPDFLQPDKFNPVTVTVLLEDEEGTFYIGPPVDLLTNKILKMDGDFKTNPKCAETNNVQIGTIGVSEYCGAMYRVKVVSLSPLRIFYIDYGNTEDSLPEHLKVCPENYRDMLPLVHKAKLVPGTTTNVRADEVINVKPVSMDSHGTILVEVEGASNITAPTQQAVKNPSEPKRSAQKVEASQPTLQHVVELIQVGWVVEMMPLNSEEGSERETTCILYCDKIPKIKHFLYETDLETIFNELPTSPNCVKEGALVFTKEEEDEYVDCDRGIVLSKGVISFPDKGTVIYASQCKEIKELPAQFASIPSMAVTLTTDQPVVFPEMIAVTFVVESKEDRNGAWALRGELKVGGQTIGGELRAWQPFMSPFPLTSGGKAILMGAVEADTLSITPPQNWDILERIQEHCNASTCKNLQMNPKVGDYVVCKEEKDSFFYRVRVDKHSADTDEFVLYAIDYAHSMISSMKNLLPMPKPLINMPQQARNVKLKGLDNSYMNEAYMSYVKDLFENETEATCEFDNMGMVTVTNSKTGTNINEELSKQLMIGYDGRQGLSALIQPAVPAGEITWLVTHSDPLYLQNPEDGSKYFGGLHLDIQIFCDTEKPYIPIPGELCFAKFCVEGDPPEFYRALCKRKVSDDMFEVRLVDFGNEFRVSVNDIRQMNKDLLVTQSLALPCKIRGVPKKLSDEVKSRMSTLLVMYAELRGSIDAKEGNQYVINSPNFLTSLGLE